MSGAEPLVIDSARPVVPSEAELHAFMADWDVFVSSVIVGMGPEREAVVRAIEGVGARPVWFERFGGRDDDPELAYLGEVARCNAVVGILGDRYGKPMATGYSATHAEYNEAQARGLRVSMWVSDGDHDGRQTDFIGDVGVFHTYGTYSGTDDLHDGVAERLRRLGAEELAPWVKLGPVIFRVRSLQSDSDQIRITAHLRDDDVYAALARIFQTPVWGGDALQFTCDFESTSVQTANMVTESTTRQTRSVDLTLTRQRGSNASNLIDVSVENRSPEDLTELAVRVALFGEENPLGSMGFIAEVPNPLAAISGTRLSEDVIGPSCAFS